MNVAPQIGTKYVLVGPLGTRVTFNDPSDPDNVGMLTNITGTDSPEVREDGEAFVHADGGAHGPFLYGRRPIVLEGLVYGHISDNQRNERVARLLQATDAMSGDATLSWQPTGGAAVFTKLRRQQPAKISGGWNKTFQISMVAADPRLYSNTLNTLTKLTTASSSITNAGNADTYPLYTVWGPVSSNMAIKIDGSPSVLFNRSLDLDQGFVIDTLNRQIVSYKRRVNWFKNPSFEHPTIGMVQNFTSEIFGIFQTGSPTLDPVAVMPAASSGFGGRTLKMTTTGTGGQTAPSTTGSEKVALAILQSGQSGNPSVTGWRLPAFDLARPNYTVVSFSILRASASPSTYVPYCAINYMNATNTPQTSAGSWIQQYRGSTVLSDTTWQRVSVAFEQPNFNGQLYGEVLLGVLNPTGNMAAGQIYYIDGVTVEFIQGSTSSAFFYPDGTTYAWEGDVDNSRTYSINADSLFPAASGYELVDFPNTPWTGLPPGAHNLSMDGTLGTGGSLKVDWRDAWL